MVAYGTFNDFLREPNGTVFFFFFSKSVSHPGFELERSEPCNKLYMKALNYAKAVRSVGVPRPSLSVQKPLQRDGPSNHTNWMKYYRVSAAWTMEWHRRVWLIIAPCFLHTEDLRNGRYVLPEVYYKHTLSFTSAEACILHLHMHKDV